MVKRRSRPGSVSQILSAGQSRLCGHFSHADRSQAFRAPVRFHETDATNTRGSGGQATLPLFVLHRAGFTMPPWSPSER